MQTGLNLRSNVPLSVLTDYNLSVIPMFILMGAFASHSGMSRELSGAGRAWLATGRGGSRRDGRRRGGFLGDQRLVGGDRRDDDA